MKETNTPATWSQEMSLSPNVIPMFDAIILEVSARRSFLVPLDAMMRIRPTYSSKLIWYLV